MTDQELIAEHERLRKKWHELKVQFEHVERRLLEIERKLPYLFHRNEPAKRRRIGRWDDEE